MIARPSIRRVAGERGQSLVLTLLVLFVLAIMLSTVIIFTSSNQRNSNRQKAVQTASSLAEAGLNNAISVLANPANAASLENTWSSGATPVLLPDGSSAHPAATKVYSGGTAAWWGTLNSDKQWVLTGQGTVKNPTGPSAADIVKKVTAMVQVNQPPSNQFDVGVWNTVYSPGTGQTCDTSIGQGITISVMVYVGGNLCMGQNAVITQPVYVGGNLTFNNKQGHIGNSGANNQINSAHVGGYCQVSSGAQVFPCKSEPVGGSNPNTNIWVTGAPTDLRGVASNFVGITAPKICWSGSTTEVASGACTNQPPGGWYTFASPGPLNPCNTSSASTVPVSTGAFPAFDTGDKIMNQSLGTTVFNLTPAASYSCYTSQGQLSWNALTRTLTVAGTVFFDGSITMTTTGNQPITYTGSGACTASDRCQSVIYASGDISINSEMLCAKVNSQGNNCDWSTPPPPVSNGWDPNTKLLIFASNGNTGITVGPSQTSFQGGLYATNTVATGQSAVTEGPLVSGTKTVVLGQQFGGTFPAIQFAPFSISQPPGGFWISPPTNFSYSG